MALAAPLCALGFAGCVWAWADDCDRSAGAACHATATSSSHGGSGGTGGTLPTGGGGHAGSGCTGTASCPDVPLGPCFQVGTKTCDKGVCGLSYVAGDAPSQVYGDCKKTVCDAQGTATAIDDDGDVYDDGNPCMDKKCTGGVLVVTARTNLGCPLGDGGTGYCVADPFDATRAVCAECNTLAGGACGGNSVCAGGTCVPSHCGNNGKDVGESDTDCGGATSGCPRCGDGKACTTPSDCQSGFCTGNQCAKATCTDQKQNQNETDIDCGGPCSGCVDGLRCVLPADCQSLVCQGNRCQIPSCFDGVQNGTETGVDCGDPAGNCPACPP
jgi:hypothetical protein